MEIIILKNEVEELTNEYEQIFKRFTNIESIMTELLSIKIYNLLKNDYNLATNYINRLLPISSFCPDIIISDYNIEDVDILILFKDKMLSGLIFKRDENFKDSFLNIVKIHNDLVLSNNEIEHNRTIIKPSIINKLLDSNNMKNISSVFFSAEDEIERRFDDEIEDKIFHNIFFASNFRKKEFINISHNDKKKLLNISLTYNCSVGEYIYNQFKSSIIHINTYKKKILNDFKNSISSKLLDTDYLYNMISFYGEQLMNDILNTKINHPSFENTNFVLMDLLLIEDETVDLLKTELQIIDRETLIEKKIEEFNNTILEIRHEIKDILKLYKVRRFKVNHDTEGNIRCSNIFFGSDYLSSAQGTQYKINYLFCMKSNGDGFDFDNLLQINNTLNLKIIYRRKVIYSLSKEIKNKLLKVQSDIVSLINYKI